MSASYKYWNDCVEPEDMEAMWSDSEVSQEWIEAGERKGQRVHLCRDPDGEPYLTQIEMRAVATITILRHFNSSLDVCMICALAEMLSDRQLFVEHYDQKTKERRVGIMQLTPEIAGWLGREMGYKKYDIEENTSLLYKPFINVYFGAAYVKWLFGCDGKERNEEFVVRAYKAGKKKASHKSTAQHFQCYMSVKDSLLLKREYMVPDVHSLTTESLSTSQNAGEECMYWDSLASPEDMNSMWRHPDVLKEWENSGERRGRVRFSIDAQKRSYLSRVEVKAVAEIINSRHFSSRGVYPEALAAIAEVCSMRFVHGVRGRTGLMGIDFPTAVWLSKDRGCHAYRVTNVDDLFNPFASMYFGASYLAWLSEYEGRVRTNEFIVQAYLGGPENVSLHGTGPYWNKFHEALRYYQDSKGDQGSCSIL